LLQEVSTYYTHDRLVIMYSVATDHGYKKLQTLQVSEAEFQCSIVATTVLCFVINFQSW